MSELTTDRGALANALAGGESTNGSGQPTGGAVQPNGVAAPATEKFWYSDLPPELQGNLEKKGWNNPTALPKALEAYFNLEKEYRNGDKVVWPKDDSDPKAFDPIYTKLGRPESAEKYQFPEGVDANIAKEMAAVMYENGVPQKAAQALATKQLQIAQAAQEVERQRVVNDQNQAEQVLKNEWGAKFNENLEYARRAMRGIGMNLDTGFVPMAAAIGAKSALKLLHLAGLNTREDNAAAIGDAQAGFGMTPNRAKAELAEKGKDLLLRARNGDKGAVAHWQRLQKAIAGDGVIEM